MLGNIDYQSDPHFVIADGVPVLDEHDLFVPGDKDKGTQDRVIKITPEVLGRIASNNNRRARDTGDLVPVTEGHTIDGKPESEQPEILGWADNFRVGPLFDTGRQALLATFRISKDPEKLAKAKKLPRRSVELWHDRWEIDPIAMLGATSPERDLGVLRLSHMTSHVLGADGKLRFQMTRCTMPVQYDANSPAQSFSPPPPPVANNPATGGPAAQQNSVSGGMPPPQADPAVVQAVLAALQGTDVWQKMMQMVSQPQTNPLPDQGNPAVTGGGGMPGADGGQPGGDALQSLLASLMGGGQGGGEQQPEKKRDDDDRVRMEAGGMPGSGGGTAYPGGNNTFLPSALTGRDRTQPPGVGRMSHNQNQQPAQPLPLPNLNGVLGTGQQTNGQAQPETVGDQLVRLTRERDAAVLYSRQLMVALELLQLQKEVQLDPAEELPQLLPLDDNQRAQRYDVMRRRYQRVGAQPVPGAPQIPGLPQPAPGMGYPVSPQYQMSQGVAQDQPPTEQEQAQVMEILQEQIKRTRQPVTREDFKVCLSRLRAGGGRGGMERVY